MKKTSTTIEKKKPVTITEYINAAPKEAQKKLREMRSCLRKAAPGAQENLKWGMPAFSYDWILFQFAAFKHHIGFYPTPSAIKAFEKRPEGIQNQPRRDSVPAGQTAAAAPDPEDR